MRCPKCQYIGYDSGTRCRNCGYEFALAADDPPIDVTIAREAPPSGRLPGGVPSALDTPLDSGARSGGLDRASGAGRPLSADLPLFTDRVADDQAPLVTPPAVPRPPLSVRRANPSRRARVRPDDDLPLELGSGQGEDTAPAAPAGAVGEGAYADSATIVRRVAAGLIDVTILGAISAAVVYLTLRLADLAVGQWRVVPVVPMAAFLMLLHGGYFILFTAAGGQTIGKMIARIRVVATPGGSERRLRVSFGTAMIRAFACLGSVLVLGAGFVPVLLRADRRAFHDRVAETRVVAA